VTTGEATGETTGCARVCQHVGIHHFSYAMNQPLAFVLTVFVALLTLCPGAPARADEALQTALASPHRSPANVARDAWRHPQETLAFFGLQPNMTVIELSPGGGWYTEILAPYLRDKGQLILAADDPDSGEAYYRRSAERMSKKLQALPDVFDKVRVLPFEVTRKIDLGAAGSVDMVLTFRNVHNWAAQGDEAVLAVFTSVFKTLKPGGVMGVVDHRLPADRTQDAKASSGYLHVAYVVKLAERAGFKWAGSSEINANPKDSADHNKGVWALPPTYANKDSDRAKFEGIGESDRFTLKFVKP
jgi:predicted methyltransferase